MKQWTLIGSMLLTVLVTSGCGALRKRAPSGAALASEKGVGACNIRFGGLFGDDMILQRDRPANVWGWAEPGRVTIQFRGQVKHATVTESGRWSVVLDPMPAGGPHTMVVKGAEETVFKNVLVGDIWVCTGQSNMEYSVGDSTGGFEAISAADFPNIRLFQVERSVASNPQVEVKGQWKVCSTGTVAAFSAVGFYFGRQLHRDLNVPIGLIGSNWGGTKAEEWMSLGALMSNSESKAMAEQWVRERQSCTKDDRAAYENKLHQYDALVDAGKAGRFPLDPGNKGVALGYAQPSFNDSDWSVVELPGLFPKDPLGATWYRKEIELPEDWAGKDLRVELGAVDDCDISYFNGHQIGVTDSKTPGFWSIPRRYVVPANHVRPGRNVVTVRVFNLCGGSGFSAPEKYLRLVDSQGRILPLTGTWKRALEADSKPLTSVKKAKPPKGIAGKGTPTALFNAMIHPLTDFSIKGALWYQGEANASKATQYGNVLKLLITDWRTYWSQGDFPFLVVQLPNYRKATESPVHQSDSWALMRDAQMQATALPNVGVAVTIDIGDPKDIHPKDKLPVGQRLALVARKIAYEHDLVHSGPTYLSHVVQGNQLRITMKDVGGGLVARGGELKRFAIAGNDKKWVWATARIDGDVIIVSSPKVIAPEAVRYAWESNPEGCNLYNKEGLPAAPFRTDSW